MHTFLTTIAITVVQWAKIPKKENTGLERLLLARSDKKSNATFSPSNYF